MEHGVYDEEELAPDFDDERPRGGALRGGRDTIATGGGAVGGGASKTLANHIQNLLEEGYIDREPKCNAAGQRVWRFIRNVAGSTGVRLQDDERLYEVEEDRHAATAAAAAAARRAGGRGDSDDGGSTDDGVGGGLLPRGPVLRARDPPPLLSVAALGGLGAASAAGVGAGRVLAVDSKFYVNPQITSNITNALSLMQSKLHTSKDLVHILGNTSTTEAFRAYLSQMIANELASTGRTAGRAFARDRYDRDKEATRKLLVLRRCLRRSD